MKATIPEQLDRITEIRGFNRFYTNLLGLLEKDLYGSGYSLSEARVLFEISKTEYCTAVQLCSALKMDRGYMSRIIHKFEKNGLICRSESKTDSRMIKIQLSQKGSKLFRELNDQADHQIADILSKLTEEEQSDLLKSMEIVKKNLTKATAKLSVRPHKKSDISYVLDRQLSLYETERNFTSQVWKTYLRQGVLDFLHKFDPQKDRMMILEYNGNPAGCIAIAHTESDTAQLRYFFAEPELRGIGAGQRLLTEALTFCKEKKYTHAFLWTVSAQETARHLYKKAGFRLTETLENSEWGVPVLEEKWEIEL